MSKIISGKKILLVEDSKLAQKIEKTILERLGCEVDIVDNGEDAIEAIKKDHYQLIFIDIGLPGINGIEATRKIREMAYSGRIVAVTAHDDCALKEQALQAGVDAYLTKPFTAPHAEKIISENC